MVMIIQLLMKNMIICIPNQNQTH